MDREPPSERELDRRAAELKRQWTADHCPAATVTLPLAPFLELVQISTYAIGALAVTGQGLRAGVDDEFQLGSELIREAATLDDHQAAVLRRLGN